MLLPILTGLDLLPLVAQLFPLWFNDSDNLWSHATMLSLSVNTGIFVMLSLVTRTSAEEQVAAEVCSMDDLSQPKRQMLMQHSPDEFEQKLAMAVGADTARNEVDKALRELQFDRNESRPYALRRLRNRIEANLSGLLGPTVAHTIINRTLPFQTGSNSATQDINLIERNLDRSQIQLTGLAADLDNLRRHHRQTLDNLPVGLCSIGSDGEMLMWNLSMERITQIPASDVVGSHLNALQQPWENIISDFISSDEEAQKQEVNDVYLQKRWVSLHKTTLEMDSKQDRVILVEDVTDYELLEQELLHNERLASIGRLAAGVAHEIGNPITGIACLAQNLEYETEMDEVRYTAGDILKQTDRVNRIVESLVNFSHSGAEMSDAQLAPSNLADCVDEAIYLLELDTLAKNVAFSNNTDRELVVLADSQRLMQAFINLLSNARDACDDTGGAITVSSQANTEEAIITIEDNGSGIPLDIQSQVFEPFYTTKDPGSGTGLGLALVYSIMDQMDGEIHLKSPHGNHINPGTCVTLKLPLGSYDALFVEEKAVADTSGTESVT